MNDNGYNGWKNYQTWNVSLYIQNEEKLYKLARGCNSYADFLFRSFRVRGVKTPDGVLWQDSKLDFSELDSMIRDLNE